MRKLIAIALLCLTASACAHEHPQPGGRCQQQGTDVEGGACALPPPSNVQPARDLRSTGEKVAVGIAQWLNAIKRRPR